MGFPRLQYLYLTCCEGEGLTRWEDVKLTCLCGGWWSLRCHLLHPVIIRIFWSFWNPGIFFSPAFLFFAAISCENCRLHVDIYFPTTHMDWFTSPFDWWYFMGDFMHHISGFRVAFLGGFLLIAGFSRKGACWCFSLHKFHQIWRNLSKKIWPIGSTLYVDTHGKHSRTPKLQVSTSFATR